jgi:serine/threonine protein kinase
MSMDVDPSRGLGEDAAPQWLGELPEPFGYRVVRKLGAGGMAEVMLATPIGDERDARSVAIKLVREDCAKYREFRELFAIEARLASRLDHPNIVRVLDYACREGARPYLVMEYVSGVDLSVALGHPRRLSVPVAAFIASEMLRGLAYAHELPNDDEIRGVVHRDLSPQNVLLSWDGAVKVADFGIAKALVGSSVSGSAVGKPAYMSPEQMRGDRLDGRSDLYSAGVVLWEMLTGRRLFRQGRVKEIFAEIALGNVPPPSSLRAEVPEELDRVTSKLVAVNPAERYARAEEALSDLERCACLPTDGAGELRAALAERFHQPPQGSVGISVMDEDPQSLEAAGATRTICTETDDPWAASAEQRVAPLGDGEKVAEPPAPPPGAMGVPAEELRGMSPDRTTGSASPRGRAVFVASAISVGIALALFALFTIGGARIGRSAAARSVSPAPSTARPGPLPESPRAAEGPVAPERAPLAPAPAPAKIGPIPSSGKPGHRESSAIRRKATPPQAPTAPASGIVDLHLESSAK